MIARTQGIDEGNGPAADLIHRLGFYAIGGVAITSRWDADIRQFHWGIWCKKWNDQPLRMGHEDVLTALEKSLPNSRAMVIWFNSETDHPTHLWYPGKSKMPCNKEQYRAIVNKYGTPNLLAPPWETE